MTTRHTPEPWVLEIRKGLGDACRDETVAEINLSLERGQANRGSIAYMQSAEHIDGIGKDELIANAHLIAAAPEMLDALIKAEAWVAQYHDTPGHDAASRSMSALLRKVIAKADGQP